MANFNEPIARPRALKREEALELATDLMVKNPVGMGNGDVFFSSNISWLSDYTLALEPHSDDLAYFITAGENFYSQATQEQKDTRTFAECARMLAVACQHMHDDRARIVYYQECASRCPDVKEKLDRFLGDALVSFDKLVQQDMRFPELQSVAEAGLAGAKPGSSRAARWSVLVALAQLHAGDVESATQFFKSAKPETQKNDKGLVRLQKELKSSGKGNTAFFSKVFGFLGNSKAIA